jgi:hypothetical protein
MLMGGYRGSSSQIVIWEPNSFFELYDGTNALRFLKKEVFVQWLKKKTQVAGEKASALKYTDFIEVISKIQMRQETLN